MLKAVLFDLDGTLLPFDENDFLKSYFKSLCKKVIPCGYEPKAFQEAIMKATQAMIHNDGSKINDDVFWDSFNASFPNKLPKEDEEVFKDYYLNEFKDVKSICEDNPEARKILDFCKQNNLPVILATNPFFPSIAQVERIAFVDMKEEDFAYITHNGNSHYCKPNPMYFKELLDKFNLLPSEVIMFGNNEYEDGMCADALGIKTYIVEGHVLTKEKVTKSFPHIQMEEIISIIKENM